MFNNSDWECKKQIQAPYDEILTSDAIQFVVELAGRFSEQREALLLRREGVQASLDARDFPNFLPETAAIRKGDWTVAPIPNDLQDRRIEITGPVERKTIINALNSGAKVFMADLEDAHSPTWEGTLQGQLNLRDAVRGTITHRSPEGKHYRLNETTATLMVRPRGWHLLEKHFYWNGHPISASLFDFGLYFFHNAKACVKKGSGPYFYLPKLESHLEARLWNDVFVFSQNYLQLPQGTIRATVLIETILAAFEMDEILYELKDHSAGLNCGRWDYIFSFIKKFSEHPEFVLPDRNVVTMREPFLEAYCELLIETCHRRKIHAMGGMAAQIPVPDNPRANREAMEKVIADKKREVELGHDGTWVAHPGLVTVVKEIFDEKMKDSNQIEFKRPAKGISAQYLLRVPKGPITAEGVRRNIRVGLQYLEAWLCGKGCVAIDHLMEDTATAEICRAQLWQWVHHPEASMEGGAAITLELVRAWMDEELMQFATQLGGSRFASSQFYRAAKLFDDLIAKPEFTEFLTLPAYEFLD